MTTIITKRSNTAGAKPVIADLAVGELAVNTVDKCPYTKNNTSQVVQVGLKSNSVTTIEQVPSLPGSPDPNTLYFIPNI